ncbi:thiol-disulfide oxidoreductase DCC family protein [Streptomyces sp. CB00072]|uniref:thiol-disulfide oxidoreductase DCC family protein n=1 Tax=Streptomyces sp. CB00072 TaxID=1703928 RepID=UPI0018E9E209|nr:DCC1-like thiol-disulfide oxidoreductase family protein [Streptomyces sp. CB00072]
MGRARTGAVNPVTEAAPAAAPGPAPYAAGGSSPVRRLTVLYDAQCPLCVHLRNWLQRQRQLVPLDLVPAGSAEARRRFPELDRAATPAEITVVGDLGQVYREASAWIVCLWALAKYRSRAHWLTTPAGRPFVRGTVLAAARYRSMALPPCAPGVRECAAPPGGPWGPR